MSSKPKTYFMSDPHFGHSNILKFVDEYRKRLLGIDSITEHDNAIINRANSIVKPNDTLYVLGDLGMAWRKLNDINCQKRVVLGNHDHETMSKYLAGLYNTKIMPMHKLQKFWITHCPIHPQELFECKNIHGHVHTNIVPDENYINLSIEMTAGYPIDMAHITRGEFTTHQITKVEDVYDQLERLNII